MKSFTLKTSEIRSFILATLGIIILAFSLVRFAYKYDLVPGGLTGFSLFLNYALDIPPGTFLLVFNTVMLLLLFRFRGLKIGVKGIYGYILLGIMIDTFILLFGEKTLVESYFTNALMIALQGFVSAIGSTMVIFNDFSTGNMSSFYLFIKKYFNISPQLFFITIDVFLTLLTILTFGFSKGILLTINMLFFFFTMKYSMVLLNKFFK